VARHLTDAALHVDLPTPARALAIGAHPDDIEFGCGATLAKWSAAGCIINHLVLTDGAKGTWDPDADTAALVATRELEQLAAAKALGSRGKVVMLGAVDGDLEATLAHRERVAYWIRVLQPDVVLGHDPWKRYRLHPDHRHAGWLTVDGIVAARDPHFSPDHGVAAHRPSALLLFEADEPDHAEDVTGYADTKLAALLEHRSQFRSTMHIEPDDDGSQLTAFRELVVGRLVDGGQRCGVEHAELFKSITDI
jgi:LmbE family N-acetylglucosaminyl deacetylase